MIARYPEHFRRNLAWVAAGHGFLFMLLLIWAVSTPKVQPITTVPTLLSFGDLVRGVPGPSIGPNVGKSVEPPAPAPLRSAPQPAPRAIEPPAPETPPAPQQQAAPEVVQPAPTPAPTPAAADPTSWSPEKVKPKPKAVTPPAPPQSAVKPRPKVKLDLNSLTEVNRDTGASSSNTVKASSHTAHANIAADVEGTEPDGTGDARHGVHGATGKSLAEKLGQELQESGVTNAIAIGPSGAPNGTGGENAWYYTLIRDQIYDLWEIPINLSDKKLQTLIRIFVEKNGVISNVTLITSSGNKEYDESAMAAVRRVGRIRQPLPDGIDGNININFKPAK